MQDGHMPMLQRTRQQGPQAGTQDSQTARATEVQEQRQGEPVTPNYAWIIDDDYIEETDAGTMGPAGLSAQQFADLKQGLGHGFRMYDDDGELYYAGRIIFADWAYGDDLPEEAFGPLNDFGAPNAGATEIRYARLNWQAL
jgi:hypothetical protein